MGAQENPHMAKLKVDLCPMLESGFASNVGAQENPHMAKFESLFFVEPSEVLGRIFAFSDCRTSFSKQLLATLSVKGIISNIVTMQTANLQRDTSTTDLTDLYVKTI